MRWVVIVLLLLTCFAGQAQTREEWMNQKNTGLRYLAEQIAALKTYAGYLEKGYAVVQGGLTMINEVKQGEFSLHKDYFIGQQKVNPVIRQSWKAAAIILSAHRIMRLYQQSGSIVKELKVLDRHHTKEILKAWNGVFKALANTISELQLVLNDDAASIPDGSRLGWIDTLYNGMQAHEQFAINLTLSTKAFVANRKLEVAANNTLRSLYRK